MLKIATQGKRRERAEVDGRHVFSILVLPADTSHASATGSAAGGVQRVTIARLASPRRKAATRRAGTLLSWWRRNVSRSVLHGDVLDRVEEDARWSGHYVFMILTSAGIAVLGLLLSSPAVVIGAMLISPMMGPIIGVGFGVALFDTRRILHASATLAGGIGLAVLFCALITLMSPLQTVTPEIAARTRPNLFDLGVAMLSGAAGTYAMIRGRHGAIVGVAIAVAVMPPLAAVGFGLATTNRAIVSGAAFLFLTNLTAISLTAAVLARIYGFAHQLSPRQSWFQAALIMIGLVTLAVPLALALKQIGWESVASRTVRDRIASEFGPDARLGDVEIVFTRSPTEIDAVVFTPKAVPGVERRLAEQLSHDLGRPAAVSIEQVRLGGEEAEESELATARGSIAVRQASDVAARLALAAGTSPDAVLLDRSRRIARVRAVALPGADLQTYYTLEQRVAAASPSWTVVLVPPALPLPELEIDEEGNVPAADQPAVQVAIWSARRLGLPVLVEGEGAGEIAELLQQQGVNASSGGERGRPRLLWADPNSG